MKISDIFKNKKIIISIIGVIVAVIAIVIGISIYSNRQVALTKDVEVNFRGYNKSGTIDYNSGKIDKKVNSLYAKRSGLSEYQVQQVLDDPSYIQELPSNLQDKATDVVNWEQELSLNFDNERGLKNGQSVKMTITNDGDKENPIKETSKKYKVSGLKKVKSISTKKQLDSVKTKFIGFNGKGVAQINSSNKLLDNQEISVKNNGKLSNGDKVTLNFKDAFPKKEGKEWTGKKKLEVKVSGLKDLSKLGNVNEVKAMTDRVAKDDADSSTENSDNKYIATFVSLYAKQDENLMEFSSFEDAPKYVEVNENDDVSTMDDDLKVMVVGLYKKESSDASEDDVYEQVHLDDVPLQDNKLYLDRIKADTTGNLTEDYTNDSLETIDHNLAADGIKLK